MDVAFDTAPLRLRLAAAGVEALPVGEDVSMYVHLLRASFPAAHEGGNVWRIEPPSPGDLRRESWDYWLGLSDPLGLLADSPVIMFPPHGVSVRVSPPADFRAGLLMLDVTAVDDADYVASPALPGADASLVDLTGNESDPTTATLSARVTLPPDTPATPPHDPTRFIWAEPAAKYAEDAEYLLTWPIVDAAHYEVWRVLESALVGASASLNDTALRALAAAQAEKFALRSLKVFGGRFRDRLPGRAPTRAIYRIRAVNEAGVPGPWSDLIGPVHIPDIRQPPAPNLVRVAAPRPSADNHTAADRRLVLEWTQPGPRQDLRFDIEALDPLTERWSIVGIKPRGALPEPGPARVFRQELSGLMPGRKSTFRVRAVREARDPIDPYGQQRRDLRSAPSEVRGGQPIGALTAPADLAGVTAVSGEGLSIVLSWSNADTYRSIEILRQGPGEFRLRRIAGIDGALENYVDSEVISGLWRYQVRVLGFSRRAESDIVHVEAP